ncbi:site-2 protease family protein [Aeromicrobium duanguangcaii]|uniref:Site-2 protease family protein n=1 Tax=Aeromicrobium duanguangcaii TaxID=2968086 RepID=A0ABY5KAL9_9ACTN|nr:site-2 protease family protein [Aeromicrobium duanguangcaii]UUI67486.1 site-2 protease family protein [Aeromicrobium duanguangcaii]
MMYAFGVIVFLVGVALSIALHEVGHMWPAKKFGVKVTQFFVGFGRTVWSFKRGETEYGLKAIPLGGFVKLVGMLPPEREERDRDGHLVVRSSDTGLFTQMATDARAAEYMDVDPEDEDRLFYRKPWWQKVIVMAGGPTVNLLIATVLFAISFMAFGVPTPTTTVAQVSDCAITDAEAGRACTAEDPITPARQAGLEPGDVLTTFNGERIDDWDELTSLIRRNGDREATIGYERNGAATQVTVNTSVLARASVDDPERVENVGFLGVSPEFVTERQGPVFVVDQMGEMIGATAKALVNLPVRMVGVVKAALGGERESDGPVSVVGASRVAGELVTYNDPGWDERAQRIISLLASLNLFLWLFNLIPLLPLDGGHIAGALWEQLRRTFARLRGKPDPGFVDVAKMLPVAYVVGLVLIVMGVVLIYADIVNPVRLS